MKLRWVASPVRANRYLLRDADSTYLENTDTGYRVQTDGTSAGWFVVCGPSANITKLSPLFDTSIEARAHAEFLYMLTGDLRNTIGL